MATICSQSASPWSGTGFILFCQSDPGLLLFGKAVGKVDGQGRDPAARFHQP